MDKLKKIIAVFFIGLILLRFFSVPAVGQLLELIKKFTETPLVNAQAGNTQTLSSNLTQVESKLAEIEAASARLLQVQQEMKQQSMEYTWLLDIKSFIDLLNTISQTVCIFQNLGSLMKSNGFAAGNCLAMANYNYYMIDLNAAMDILKTITTSMKNMSNGERVHNYKQALDLMHRVTKGLGEMNLALMRAETQNRTSQKMQEGRYNVVFMGRKAQSFF